MRPPPEGVRGPEVVRDALPVNGFPVKTRLSVGEGGENNACWVVSRDV